MSIPMYTILNCILYAIFINESFDSLLLNSHWSVIKPPKIPFAVLIWASSVHILLEKSEELKTLWKFCQYPS